jgi:hypothetical protein
MAKVEDAVNQLIGAVELLATANPCPQGTRDALAAARAAMAPPVEGGEPPAAAEAEAETEEKHAKHGKGK